MLAATLFLYLVQVQDPGLPYSPHSPRSGQMQQSALRSPTDGGEDSGSEDPRRQEGVYEQREFVKRFNSLLNALVDFASSYNGGHAIDAKKAKAVRKAMRQLEKSDWFRPTKGE
jgi:hypothetical protein